MCYPDGARPPLPPVGGAASDQGDLTLASADGTRFMAYFARAARPTGRGVVILPDVRGLHGFYKDLAQRFAEAGIDSVAIDYFGRSDPRGSRAEGFDWGPHIEKTRPATIDADAAAAAAHLRSPAGGGAESVFSVGFCFGGDSSWRQSRNGFQGCVGFYGQPARFRAAVDDLTTLVAPILMLIAGADRTPREEHVKLDADLDRASVPHRMVIYEGAPHSFFDRAQDQWREACDDAWRQVLEFIAGGRPVTSGSAG